MRHSIKNRVLSGLMSFVIAVGFVLSTAIPDIFGHTVMADVTPLLVFDSASQVNYSTILGRASDFGIVADQLDQPAGKHMETNFAINIYNGNHNFDVDMAGSAPVPFIVGEVTPGSKMVTGKNYDSNQIFNVYTTSEIINNGLFVGDDNFKGKIYYTELELKDINSNVNKMIDRFQTQSSLLLNKQAIDTTGILNIKTLDLSDPSFKQSTVYINVESGSELESAISQSGFTIVKDSSTVVVFNILSSDSITINKCNVQLTDQANKTIASDTKWGEAENAHNDDVDQQIARKIIWNIPNASNVKLHETAGLFLLPNENTSTEVTGSSAGWVASAGTVKIGDGEWHYIFKDRNVDLIDTDTSSIHFAARKTFTDSFAVAPGEELNELTNIYAAKDQYKFSFAEATDSSFSSIKDGTESYVYTDECGKVTFPSLSFKKSDYSSGPVTYYYVIKELESDKVQKPDSISISEGEIDIAVTVSLVNGELNYEISSWKYLGKNKTQLYATNENIPMSGTEFSLGGIYNLYTGGFGSLSITKSLSSNMSDSEKTDFNNAYPSKTYKVAVKQGQYYVQDKNGTLGTSEKYFEVALDSEPLVINKLIPGEYTIVENEGDLAGFNLSKSITVDGTVTDTVTLVGNDSKNVVVTNDYDKIDLSNKGKLTVTKNATFDKGSPDISNKEFEIALLSSDSEYVNLNGTVTTEPSWVKIKAGDSFDFNGLDLSKSYYVLEKKASAEINGYSLSVEGYSPDDAKGYYKSNSPVVFNSNTELTVALKNNYSMITGTLKITKSFVDGNGTPISDEAFKNVVIKVTGSDNVTREIKYKDFTNGEYVFDAFPVGVCVITEDYSSAVNNVPTGYYFDSLKINDVVTNSTTCNVGQWYTPDVKLKNTYTTEPTYGSLKIKKNITGDTGYDESKEFDVTVTFNTAVKCKIDGVESTEAKTDYQVKVSVNQPVIISNIPAGTTYTVTETLSDSDTSAGYAKAATDNIVYGNTNKQISNNNTDTVKVNNTYTKQSTPTTASLTITKSFSGETLTKDEFESELTFTVKNTTTGKYIDKDGNESATEVKFTMKEAGFTQDSSGKWTKTFTNLAYGEYEVTEVDTAIGGYTLVTTGTNASTTSGTVKLSSTDKEGTVAITDNYTKNADEGELTITKSFSGETLTKDEFESELTFTVKNTTTGKYIDKDGNESATEVKFTMKEAGFTQDSSGKWTKTFTNLAYGEYEVTEVDTAIGGYTLVTTGTNASTTSGTVKLSSTDKEGTVAITDNYTKNADEGELTITKSFSGETLTKDEFESELTFTVKNTTTGKYIDKDGNESATEVKFTMKEAGFTQDSSGKWTKTFTNLAYGEYEVTEVDTAIGGYTLVTTGTNASTTSGTVKLSSTDKEGTVAITDNYTKNADEGELTITKSFSGETLTKDEFESELTFTVKNTTTGKYIDKDGNESATEVKFTMKEAGFTQDSSGKWTKTFTNLAYGEYEVTEVDTAIGGYTLVTTGTNASTTSGTVKLSSTDKEGTVAITDNYTKNADEGELTITKSFSGETLTKDEFESELTFTVKNTTTGKYIDKDGNESATEVKFTMKEAGFTQDSSGKWTKTFTNLAYGEYEVTEVDTAIGGYTLVTTGTNASTTSGTVKLSSTDKEGTVAITDNYTKNADEGELTITKSFSGETLTKDEFESELTFTVKNTTTGKYIDKDGNESATEVKFTMKEAGFTQDSSGKWTKTFTNLAYGEYEVTEVDTAIGGYTLVTTGTNASTTSGTVKLSSTDKEGTVAITDNYTKNADEGELTITKSFSGETLTKDEFESELTFTVKNTTTGKYIDKDGNESATEVKFTMKEAGFTQDSSGKWTKTFTNLAYGEYEVTEVDTAIGGYTLVTTGTNASTTSGTVKLSSTDKEGTVAITDNYTKINATTDKLTLYKVVSGCDPLSNTPVNFYVTDEFGTTYFYLDANGDTVSSSTKTAIPVTPGTPVDLKLQSGKYFVSEDPLSYSDYNFLLTSSKTSETVDFDASVGAVVTLINKYQKNVQPTEPTNPTQPTSPTTPTSPTNPSSPTTPTETTGTTTSETPVTCSVPISKQDVGGLEINGAVLTIVNADGFSNDLSGVTVTQNGQPASGLVVSADSVSFTTVESSSAIVSGLPVGTYVLTETVVPIGYVVAESITFRVDTEGNVWVCGTPEEKVQMIVMIDRTDPIVSQVKVDDVVVPPENYTVNPDKTVTLKDEYTKTLVAGVHRITITYTDGTETTVEITITAGAAKVPATGEGSDYLMIAGAVALISSAAVALAYTFYKRWREED